VVGRSTVDPNIPHLRTSEFLGLPNTLMQQAMQTPGDSFKRKGGMNAPSSQGPDRRREQRSSLRVCSCRKCVSGRRRSFVEEMLTSLPASERKRAEAAYAEEEKPVSGEKPVDADDDDVCIAAKLMPQRGSLVDPPSALLAHLAAPETTAQAEDALSFWGDAPVAKPMLRRSRSGLTSSCSPFQSANDLDGDDENDDVEMLKMLENGSPSPPRPRTAVRMTRFSREPLVEISLENKELNDLDAAGIVALIQKGATRLLLSRNGLGDKTAIAIADCLATNKSLEYLSLSFNQIGQAGGLALANALAQNTSLKSFYIAGNLLDDATKGAIQSANLRRNPPLSGLNGLVV
jgi:hypothetical protein